MNPLFDENADKEQDGEELEFDIVLEGDDNATEEKNPKKSDEDTHNAGEIDTADEENSDSAATTGDDGEELPVSKRVEKRIGKLTKDKYALEARIAELEREKAELAKKAQDSDLTVAETRRRAIAMKENQLTEAKKVAQAQLVAAKSAGDYDAEVKIQDVLDTIRSETAQLTELKTRMGTYTQRESKQEDRAQVEQQQTVQQPPQMSKRAFKWFNDNPWIKEDRVMVAATEQIHNQILEDGYDPREDEDEYFSELDARLQKVFPSLVKKKKGTTQTVDGGRPSMARSGTPGKVNVTLTKNEREIAKKMGISEKDFAKEKYKIMQRNGEA